jgi:hypothetical protein
MSKRARWDGVEPIPVYPPGDVEAFHRRETLDVVEPRASTCPVTCRSASTRSSLRAIRAGRSLNTTRPARSPATALRRSS